MSFFEDLCPCTGFGGVIFLDCAQVPYEMLFANCGVSKKRPCAGFWCQRLVDGLQKLANVSHVLRISGAAAHS